MCENKSQNQKTKKMKSILDIKPEHFGYKYRKLSEEHDLDEVI